MNFKELRDKKLRPIFDKISKELSEKGINHEVIDENDYDAYSSDNYIGMIFPDHGDTGFEHFNNPTISIVHHTERGYLDVHTVIVNEMGSLAPYRLDEHVIITFATLSEYNQSYLVVQNGKGGIKGVIQLDPKLKSHQKKYVKLSVSTV